MRRRDHTVQKRNEMHAHAAQTHAAHERMSSMR